ncbi:MAG: hypothetical protein QME79_12120 [Bacillota bacterium]|nr:hypothetical protein [Bacillota bacterium]
MKVLTAGDPGAEHAGHRLSPEGPIIDLGSEVIAETVRSSLERTEGLTLVKITARELGQRLRKTLAPDAETLTLLDSLSTAVPKELLLKHLTYLAQSAVTRVLVDRYEEQPVDIPAVLRGVLSPQEGTRRGPSRTTLLDRLNQCINVPQRTFLVDYLEEASQALSGGDSAWASEVVALLRRHYFITKRRVRRALGGLELAPDSFRAATLLAYDIVDLAFPLAESVDVKTRDIPGRRLDEDTYGCLVLEFVCLGIHLTKRALVDLPIGNRRRARILGALVEGIDGLLPKACRGLPGLNIDQLNERDQEYCGYKELGVTRRMAGIMFSEGSLLWAFGRHVSETLVNDLELTCLGWAAKYGQELHDRLLVSKMLEPFFESNRRRSIDDLDKFEGRWFRAGAPDQDSAGLVLAGNSASSASGSPTTNSPGKRLTLQDALRLHDLESVPKPMERFFLQSTQKLVDEYGEDWIRQNRGRLRDELEFLEREFW